MPTRLAIAAPFALAATLAVGCGTTRTSDTGRTATEQLLISDAIDRAVGELDLQTLRGQSVYFDDQYLSGAVDRGYLISTLRQQLLANGSVLKDSRDQADFVVEARAGAVGTNRNDLLFGIPSTNLPQIAPLQGVPAAIPEVPLAKRRDQRGIVKVAVFAYHRESGKPVWQSGIAQEESTMNDVWLLGAGPFQHGTLNKDPADLVEGEPWQANSLGNAGPPSVAQQAVFADPGQLVAAEAPAAEPPAEQVAAQSKEPPATEPNDPPAEARSPERVAQAESQSRSGAGEPGAFTPADVMAMPPTAAPPAIESAAVAPPAFILPATAEGSVITPAPDHQGSFYSIQQGAMAPHRDEVTNEPQGDLVPLPEPIVD